METTLPFSGFYCSLHDDAVDHTIDMIFEDNENLKQHLSDNCDYREVYTKYAAEYTRAFSEEFKIDLSFKSLQSPREYNFTTDRIFADISIAEIKRLYTAVDKTILQKCAAERFTTRPGFISFYDPDIKTWRAVDTWDCNQVGTLIIAVVAAENPDYDQWSEMALMESAQCNGYIDNWIHESTPCAQRLYKIADYLNTREAR